MCPWPTGGGWVEEGEMDALKKCNLTLAPKTRWIWRDGSGENEMKSISQSAQVQ